MLALFRYGLLTILLAACADDAARYRDTSSLEQPPTLRAVKAMPDDADDSAVPEKHKPGLHDSVYLIDGSPPVLKIRQPFDLAWRSVNQALKLREIRITDQERSTGHLYVSFEPENFFQHMASWFSEPKEHAVYLLSIRDADGESSITAERARASEQNLTAETRQEADASGDLLTALYQTIRDDLVEE